jgi:uncharacterized YccA/Bax inhibitor family protein
MRHDVLMANPVLTPKAFEQAGYGSGQVMTKEGAANSIAVLFGIFGIATFFGWQMTDADPYGSFPGWLMIAGLVAFAIAIGINFVKHQAMPLGIGYAVVKGLFVGGFSAVLDARYNGVAIQALLATIAVFAVMWTLWRTGIIKVTEKVRSVIMAATLGVMVMYLGAFVASFFTTVSFLSSSSGLGIALSVAVAGLAAFNLLLDFDMIEQGIAHRAPAYMNWFAAFGLLVTVAWLYLELIRLFAKLQRR